MPRRLSENEQMLILKLIRYFQLEKAAGGPILPVTAINNRVSEALAISLSTVQKIRTKGVEKDQEFKTEMKTAIAVSRARPCYAVSEHIVRARVYARYAAGEHVTLRSLKTNLYNIDGLDISTYSLWKGLKEWKFKWRSCSISNRKYLMEQPNISHKRLMFLREFKINGSSPFALNPVFLDETWFYSKGGFRKSWQDDTLQTVRKRTGEGVRYIVVHAGSEDGFVENASLVFKSGSKSGEYHDSMNCANSEKWFTEQLLLN